MGEYIDGKKYGRFKEYDYDGNLIFESKYVNDESRSDTGDYYDKEGYLMFEGSLFNGEKWIGKGKEYNFINFE